MKSFEARSKYNFLRNTFYSDDFYGMPVIYTDERIDLENLQLIACNKTAQLSKKDLNKTIHFFVEDYSFSALYTYPDRYIKRYKKYKQILTPDFSMYTDMPIAVQIFNKFRRQWCGAYWQENGLIVIPAVGWGDERTFDFCFCGIAKNSVVAISTLGTTRAKDAFMKGFNKMREVLNPSNIICYGTPYPEMELTKNDITIPLSYNEECKRKKYEIKAQGELPM